MVNANPVVLENAKTGTTDWVLSCPAQHQEIEGYASVTSVNKGEQIKLYVNTGAAHFTLEAYRMGWYQGLGASQVFGPVTVPGTKQIIPEIDNDTGLVDCGWVNPYVLQTVSEESQEAWLSGIYLVKLTEQDGGKQSYITFTIRDDQRKAELLMQQNVTTYQAYNNWGGKSLYKWNSTDNKRASQVSFNRPYAGNQQNPLAAYGVGAGEFLCNVQPNNPEYPISNAGWECNMLRWLEREGFDVAYCTNLDVHDFPDLLLNYKAWIASGHDEYWSWEMRNNLETALENGIHLGFFSANTGYWQIRFESSELSKQANRIMVCHKSAKRDNLSMDVSKSHLTSCQWRDEPVLRPEAQLSGVMYTADPIDGDIIISNTKHWALYGTGLTEGSRLKGLLGYEVDCIHDSSPSNIEILAISPWIKLNDATSNGTAHMTVYEAGSKAMVFATGTIQWSWALDDFNVPTLRDSKLNPAAQRLTTNILRRFIGADNSH